MKKVPRQVTKKAEFIAGAWEEEASESKFSSLTSTQYRSQIKAVTDIEADISGLEASVTAKREELDAARKTLSTTTKRVISAVRADPDHGSDSPLLAAMGYVTDSHRRSRGSNQANGNGNGNGTAQSQA